MSRKYSGYSNIVSGKTLDPYAGALIARMTAVGEAPSAGQAAAINTCIVSLRIAGLFETQNDVLVVTRGYGVNSTKMNWLGNYCNATGINNPTYTANVGYRSNASTSYINSNYNPSVNGVLYIQNNASFGIKTNSVFNNLIYWGGYDTFSETLLGKRYGSNEYTSAYTINNLGNYYLTNRNNNANQQLYNNNLTETTNINSINTPNINLYLLVTNQNGVLSVLTPITQFIELYNFGKSISLANFQTFQTIFNTYFASI